MIRKLDTSAQTVLVETDLGEAYAKFPGSSENDQFLALEVVGVEAARFLGLRTFDTAIINNPHPGLIEFGSGESSLAGPVFVSRAEKGVTWSGESEDLVAVANRAAISGLLVLDTWLQNCDRYRAHGATPHNNLGNVFLSRELHSKGRRGATFELVAMDHTHIITCGSEITVKKLGHIDRHKERLLYGNFPGFREHVNPDELRKFLARLKQFERADAEAIVSKIPSQWLRGQGIGAALVEYLASRAAFIVGEIGTLLAETGWIHWQIEL